MQHGKLFSKQDMTQQTNLNTNLLSLFIAVKPDTLVVIGIRKPILYNFPLS